MVRAQPRFKGAPNRTQQGGSVWERRHSNTGEFTALGGNSECDCRCRRSPAIFTIPLNTAKEKWWHTIANMDESGYNDNYDPQQ